jgi:hypothetical protein
MSLCKAFELDCSFLTRLLLVAVLPLVLVIASIASPRAQEVFGAPGEPGADCFTDGCFAGNGTDGESVTGVNAFGGPGGAGGNAEGNFGFGGNGGNGGAASGVNAFGGPGGAAGNFPLSGGGADDGGNGGDAFASDTETSNGSHDVTASATAVGGAGGIPIQGQGGGGGGGNATATSSASANGTGDATASATATGGAGAGPFSGPNGNATATSSAFANGTGDATASATATNGDLPFSPVFSSVSATSYAETANGGLAQAQASTDVGSSTSIAKTSFGGVSVQSTAEALFGGTAIAIAQGGTGQPLDIPPGQGFSIALPDKADASTLIGGESNVADALLGPDDKIFGAAILIDSSTFNFSFQRGRAYGVVTAKALAVLEALLWGFHNAHSGVCFPSYDRIAEGAHCARSTVAEAIKALEDAGVLSWVQRVKRVRERCSDLLGDNGWRWRVLRTSNAYAFADPSPAVDRPISFF